MDNKFGVFLHELRKKDNSSLREFSERLGISHTYLDKLEKGYDPRTKKPVAPTVETVNMIADSLKMPREELMRIGGFIEPSPTVSQLTQKEERDIAKELDDILSGMNSDSLMFDGEPLDEETKELLRASLESSLRMAKIIAKKKYTPNKYRKE